jgi:hypothetical protein
MPNSLRARIQLFVLLGITLAVASGCIWWGPRGEGFRDGGGEGRGFEHHEDHDRGWHDGDRH